VFSVWEGAFGFREICVAVHVLVSLVTCCVVFALFCGVFALFFWVVSVFRVLTNYANLTSETAR
jgi:hypothetical protein